MVGVGNQIQNVAPKSQPSCTQYMWLVENSTLKFHLKFNENLMNVLDYMLVYNSKLH